MGSSSTEQQATMIRRGLAEFAATRARILIGKGRVKDAIDAMVDIASQYDELMDTLFRDPPNTPVEFCGLPRRLTEILQDCGYKVIADLRADWPGNLLAKPNIEVHNHYLVGKMLMRFNLLEPFKPSDYADELHLTLTKDKK